MVAMIAEPRQPRPPPRISTVSDSSTSQAWELVADGVVAEAAESMPTTVKDAPDIEARLVACMAGIESARTALSNGEATAAIDAYLVETLSAINAVRAAMPSKSNDDGIINAAAVPPNSSFTITGGIEGGDDDDDDDNDATSLISDVAIASNVDLREEAQYTRSFSLPPLSPHTYADSTHATSISDIDDMDDVNAAPGHLRSLSHIPEARLRGSLSRGLSSSSLRSNNSEGKIIDLLPSSNMNTGGGGGGGGSSARRSRSVGRSRSMTGGTTSGIVGGVGATTTAPAAATTTTHSTIQPQSKSACSSRSSSPMSSVRGIGMGGSTIATHSVISGQQNNRIRSSDSIHSGHSSLDGMFDPDLLLDRLGFIDLDPPLPHEIRCGPLGTLGQFDGKNNNSGGLTPVNERLSEATLDDCHAFNDLFYCGVSSGKGKGEGDVPSIAHSSLSGMRSGGDNMSIGSLSVGSFKGGGQSRGGSLTGGSLMGDGENSVLLGTLDEEGEDESQ